MAVIIRQEKQQDYEAVISLTELAFREMEISSHDEHFLVERLRRSQDFISELSLVAELDGKIVGHILFTPLDIVDKDSVFKSLVLAPVSVLPDYQNRGIGAKLIIEGHRIAESLGFESVILVGHPAYYPRFGYKKASQFGIKLSFEVPDDAVMAIELVPGKLAGVHGTVLFPKEFELEA